VFHTEFISSFLQPYVYFTLASTGSTGSTARLRDFINQSDAVGVADFADKCLALFDH